MKCCRKTTIEQAAQLLFSAKKVALFSHTRPDGDTIGAGVALSLALDRAGVEANLFCDTPLTASFRHFPETEKIHTEFFGKYDLYVAVDCGDIFRLGDFSGVYGHSDATLTIDHHGGEYYSAYNCLYPYASTCQIIYEILQYAKMPIDQTTATYLYMGLCTDTGNFAHANTDKACFDMAGTLLSLGAETELVSRVFFKDVSLPRLKLLGKAIENLKTYHDGKLALLYVTRKQLEQLGLQESDTEGLVQYAINVDTALIGVSLCEHGKNTYKVSMRGKNFDVRQICRQFGGGGHVLASGCMISGNFYDVIDKIVFVAGTCL